MKLSSQIPPWFFTGLAFPLAVLNLWFFAQLYQAFAGIISTFILAGIIALILNNLVVFVQRYLRLKRGWAITLVFFTFLVIVGLLSIFSLPYLTVRFFELLNALPAWVAESRDSITNFGYWTDDSNLPVNMTAIIGNIANDLEAKIQGAIQGIPGFMFGALGGFFSIFFLFVLTIFFLACGGPLIKNCLVSWLPGETGMITLNILRRNFNSYILNQLILASVLMVAITPTLMIIQAPFPILSGLTIGLMGFIPFGAILGILGISFLFLLKSFWLGVRVFVIVLLVDQVIENVLPPRLLGKLTGLNPIVILFSVMLGATLAGFYGIITAVPIAATIKALFLTPNAPFSTVEEPSPPLPES